jgi:hypothetical protein
MDQSDVLRGENSTGATHQQVWNLHKQRNINVAVVIPLRNLYFIKFYHITTA